MKSMTSHVTASILILFLIASPVQAQDDSAQFAEGLMRHQLDALKQGDLQAFVEKGNRAFKEFTDKYTFESYTLQHQSYLAKGYRLEYITAIKRLGMVEHLWIVRINDYKYEQLGSLSLSHGKVVGFDLH